MTKTFSQNCFLVVNSNYTFVCLVLTDSRERTIYEISDEIDCVQEDNKLDKSAQYRNQIKELLEKRQDLKDELHLTLKKLVLNKTPLPDIDGTLKSFCLK